MDRLLNTKDLIEWKNQRDNQVIYASDSKAKKKLVLTLNGGYQVVYRGYVKLETDQVASAIETYNSLRVEGKKEEDEKEFVESTIKDLRNDDVRKILYGYYNFLMDEFNGNASEEAINMYIEQEFKKGN